MQKFYFKSALTGIILIFTLSFTGQSQYVANPFINPYNPGQYGFSLGMQNPLNQNSVGGEYLIDFDHFEWLNWTNGGEYKI